MTPHWGGYCLLLFLSAMPLSWSLTVGGHFELEEGPSTCALLTDQHTANQGLHQMWCVWRDVPRIPSKTKEANFDGAFVEKPVSNNNPCL